MKLSRSNKLFLALCILVEILLIIAAYYNMATHTIVLVSCGQMIRTHVPHAITQICTETKMINWAAFIH